MPAPAVTPGSSGRARRSSGAATLGSLIQATLAALATARRAGLRGSLLWILRNLPATCLLVAVFISIGVLTSTVLRSSLPEVERFVGWDLEKLRSGRVWETFPGTLIQGKPGIKWHQPLFMFAFVGALEYQAGSLRAIATFFLVDWLSAPITVLTLWALASAGSETASILLHAPSSGQSAASIGAGVAAAALLPRPLWYIAVGAFVAVVAASSITQDLSTSIAHLYGSAIGLAIGLVVLRPRAKRRRFVAA